MPHRTALLVSLFTLASACSAQDISELRGAELNAALAGTYAVHDRVATISTLPGMGEYEMVGHYYGITTITDTGEGLLIAQRYCFGNVQWDGPVEILMSPEAIAATPVFEAELTLTESDQGVRISRPLLEVTVGFTDSSSTPTLPTGPDDERIIDADEDGHPGVTVHMEGPVSGDIYIARIERNQWDAEVTPNGHLVGLISDTSEQIILDASDPVLMLQIEDVPDPDPSKSTVHLIPVEASYDCVSLAGGYEDLGF